MNYCVFLRLLLLFVWFKISTNITEDVTLSLHDKIASIDQEIQTVQKMSFLVNRKQTKNTDTQFKRNEQLFQRVQIRKLSSTMIDVSNEIKTIFSNYAKVQDKLKYFQSMKQKLIDRTQAVETIGIPSKRTQGLNYYNFVALRIGRNLYSVQGQIIFQIQTKRNSKNILDQNINREQFLLMSSSRNQHLVIVQQLGNQISSDKNCPSLQVSHIELKGRQLKISEKTQHNRLIIPSDFISKNNHHCLIDSKHSKPTQPNYPVNAYKQIFAFYMLSHKKTHYILTSDSAIHFYKFSTESEQLVIDNNRTLLLENVLAKKIENKNIYMHIDSPNKQQKFIKFIKMNTLLIGLTSHNRIFTINLINYLGSRKKTLLQYYEHISPEFQKIRELKYNDQDLRYFYAVGVTHVYQYEISSLKITKKFFLSYPLCQQMQNICTRSISILEQFIFVQVQVRQIINNISNSNSQFSLIQKATGRHNSWIIPFTHYSKCSQQKKIMLTKNKNSNYLISLACYFSNHQIYDQKKPTYLIYEHLALQTADQSFSGGQINGVDLGKLRLPLIAFSIGLILYISIKRSNKKSPEQVQKQQKIKQQFQQEIIDKIQKEKARKSFNSGAKASFKIQ